MVGGMHFKDVVVAMWPSEMKLKHVNHDTLRGQFSFVHVTFVPFVTFAFAGNI